MNNPVLRGDSSAPMSFSLGFAKRPGTSFLEKMEKDLFKKGYRCLEHALKKRKGFLFLHDKKTVSFRHKESYNNGGENYIKR